VEPVTFDTKCLVECDAVKFGKYLRTVQRNTLIPCSEIILPRDGRNVLRMPLNFASLREITYLKTVFFMAKERIQFLAFVKTVMNTQVIQKAEIFTS
jgi:hypothetical protein